MKKIERSIFIILIFISYLPVHSQAGLRPRGDVDCDWRVSINDVSVIIDSIMRQTKYHSFYNYACDVNGDKKINISDAVMLIDAILGQEMAPMPSYSGTLPVLFINTEGYRNIDSKEEYLHADWWLDNMGIEGYESIGSPDNPQGMQIKGRGNYTWVIFKKKSFRLKLDSKQPVLGMHNDRHFCLLAHPDDHYAKLKNTMGFELSRRIGLAYTPEQRPIEVVLNGQYIGLYFLTEKIRVGKHRVNIEEQMDGETDAEMITGGWLLEIDNYRQDHQFDIKERNNGQNWYDWIWFTLHSPEELSNEQKQYIIQFLTKTNDAIYAPNKTDHQWEQYIDIDSLVCFYIVQEMLDNIEAFAGSCFLHKDRGDTTKLIFGPVWDFGQAFGRIERTDATDFNYFVYQDCSFDNTHWIEEIAKFPKFQYAVIKRWREFYNSGFNGLDIDQFIEDFTNHIREAIRCDGARWTRIKLDQEAELFKNYLHSKISWLDSKWGVAANVDNDGQEIHP